MTATIKSFFKLLRLSQWSKAAFVFIGVLYSGSTQLLPQALLAALAFCLLASAVYIYNDIQDLDEDRLHPKKCERALVSGEVSLDAAVIVLIFLLLGGLLLGWSISVNLILILGIYLLINIAYNHFLKNLPIVDVGCIAAGFMLRVLAGTTGIGLTPSNWLTFLTILLSLFIALGKRRLEKQLGLHDQVRVVLKKYSTPLLDFLLISAALACFFTYLLYVIDVRDESFYFLLTLPFAAIGLWRFYWLTTRPTNNDDPISLFFSDTLSRFNLLCFLVLTLIALFG